MPFHCVGMLVLRKSFLVNRFTICLFWLPLQWWRVCSESSWQWQVHVLWLEQLWLELSREPYSWSCGSAQRKTSGTASYVLSLAAPAPSHNVRVWSASYIPSCTGLPKTGATNQNAPRLISEYLWLLRQRNDSNSITIVKETRELRDKEWNKDLCCFGKGLSPW